MLNKRPTQAGFSLIEMLFTITILAFILTVLLATMLYTVNTISEAKYRSNAVAKASTCLDKFKTARTGGWILFNSTAEAITCDGATVNGYGRTSQITTIGGGDSGGGLYCLRILGDFSERGGDDGHVKISVQVGWEHFNAQIGVGSGCDFSQKNRTATLEQIFYRYNDEQAI